MIVIGQRWVSGTPTENFGKWVIEALILDRQRQDFIAYDLLSVFFDPQEGQTVKTPFKKWHRGVSGMISGGVSTHAVDIIAKWNDPHIDVTALKDIVDKFQEQVTIFKNSLEGVAL